LKRLKNGGEGPAVKRKSSGIAPAAEETWKKRTTEGNAREKNEEGFDEVKRYFKD